MKKLCLLICSLLLLTACGGRKEAVPDVDLEELYESIEELYQWNDGYMVDIEGEMLESAYPGLSDIPVEQFVAKMPIMSSVVNELVFMQCETEKDAETAAAVLQDRIDVQAEGGAWYPESMDAWRKGIVIRQGTYVGMIASAEHQDEISELFNQQFL